MAEKETSSRSTLLHCPRKEKHENSWSSVRTDIRKSFCEPMQLYERWQWLLIHRCESAVTPLSPVCPQTHTKVYLYRWEHEWWDVCLCVCSVLWERRSLYTRFSMPGRGCCIGTAASVLPACWASCKTGMLHSGHTFLTSNHLMRHLGERRGIRDRVKAKKAEINKGNRTCKSPL